MIKQNDNNNQAKKLKHKLAPDFQILGIPHHSFQFQIPRKTLEAMNREKHHLLWEIS